ncbi:MAG: D-2-hydroxyacid dehydrogenase [Pseudomonadota bacterium]
MPAILVYVPGRAKAARYRDLIGARYPDLPLAVASTPEEAAPHLPLVEVLAGWGMPGDLLRRMPRLRWLHKVGAGVEDVLDADALPDHVVLTRSPGVLIAPRMIEFVMGSVYFFTQRFRYALAQQSRRAWDSSTMVDLAAGQTMGVAGLGDIGRLIAERAAANGLEVIGWRRTNKPEPAIARLYRGKGELLAFLAACDFLVLVLPSTPETKGLIDARALVSMRPNAVLINVGRGTAVVEPDLVAALAARRIAGAALDVFAEEPLPPASPLWGLDNVLMTPHVSGPIVPDDVTPFFLDNLARYLDGRPLMRAVDRAAGY